MAIFPLLLLVLWLGGLIASVAVDTRRYRREPPPQAISVLIPCHNGGDHIVSTVESVFASWPEALLDVQVIDDASTDDTAAHLSHLGKRFPLRVIHHPQNLGKSSSLNHAVHTCRHDLVLFLDADTHLNPKALQELITRMAHSPGLAAVSCPCTPANTGWLPAMQALEYNMHRLFIGASNLFSVHALWGGCLMTRVSVFLNHQGFTTNSVAEDTDYAFRLNRSGHRVEQCSQRVKTLVPDTLPSWFRQKVRWTSGVFQCGFRYPRVWCTSPVILLSLAVNLVLIANAFLGWIDGFSGTDLLRTLDRLHDRDPSLVSILQSITAYEEAMGFILDLLTGIMFIFFSIAFVIPLINHFRDILKLALIIPYTFGYLPLFTLVTAVGFFFWAIKLRKLSARQRAW